MRVLRAFVIGVVIVMSFSHDSNAAVPSSITVQGKLTSPSGVPLPSGLRQFTFRIFNASTVGTQVWPPSGGEVQSITSSTEGLWVGLVGAVSPLTDAVFADTVRWLEINVDGTTLPRVRLVTGAFAFRVATVDGATGGNITSKVSIGTGHTNTGSDGFVAGVGNQVLGDEASVTGGSDNVASGRRSHIGGGDNNIAGDTAAIVVGGYDNAATEEFSVVSGGRGNSAAQSGSTIAGGQSNTASGESSSIGGGFSNTVSDSGAVVSGGRDNSASGRFSTVGGGRGNKARGRYSVVAGGGPFGSGFAADSNAARGAFSAIVGGTGNLASGDNAFVGGGEGNSATAAGSVVVGGGFNEATSNYSFVGGGGGTGVAATNSASNTRATVVGGGFNNAAGAAAFVGGGEHNVARGSHSTVGGGGGIIDADSNAANGEYATVPGGRGNVAAGDYAFASGRRAKSNHVGSFVWADSTDADFASTGADQFLIRASGGVGIGTNTPEAQLHVMVGNVAGISGNSNASAVFERNSDNYIHMLTPSANQCGIVFGISGNSLMGSIRFNPAGTEKGYHFRCGNNTVRLVLDSLGNLTADGCIVGSNIACVSDARFKRNIETLPDALRAVEKLRGVRYEWRTDEFADRDFPKGEQVGLVAQEVREIVPQAVVQQSDGYLAVDYARLVPLLIEGMKEQQRQIDALKKTLKTMSP